MTLEGADSSMIESKSGGVVPTPTANELTARFEQVIADPVAGRITPAEANRITQEVGSELRVVETALRAARLEVKQRGGH